MLMTTKEISEALKVKPTTVYRMIKDGRIPQKFVTKIGDDWRFNGEAIEEHLLGIYVEPPSNP